MQKLCEIHKHCEPQKLCTIRKLPRKKLPRTQTLWVMQKLSISQKLRITLTSRHLLARALPLASVLMLAGCSDPNEHFCAKYQFYHDNLTAPDSMPLIQIREQLQHDLKDPRADWDKTAMALFVLGDIEQKRQRTNETPTEFCFRTERWALFRSSKD